MEQQADTILIRQILILDDDPFILKTTDFMLRQLGHQQINTAQCAEEALERIANATPPIDIVLCDLNMPDIDGIEFLRRLGEVHYCGGVALISGEDERTLSTAGSLASGYELALLGAIAKPLSVKKLEAILQRWNGPKKASQPHAEVISFSAKELLEAIQEGQFIPYFQPKVNLHTSGVVGMEALARWQHPQHGMIFPDTFIPLIEESGLIDELTISIANQAFKQLNEWRKQGFDLKVAVNISMKSLMDLGFTDRFLGMISAAGLENESVILEVTESQFMAERLHSLNNLIRLRMKKITISIDDFGTGYSSLSQLRELPFDELKIDKSFVQNAAVDVKAHSILESGIRMGKTLGMNVIAEGVESEEDWFRLEEMGCDLAQGYFIARPMPAEDVLPWLRQWQPPAPKK